MFDPVTCLLVYLLIGALIWALNDPHAYRDLIVRSYLRTTGKVCGLPILILAIVVAIVLWPRTVVAAAKALRSVGR